MLMPFFFKTGVHSLRIISYVFLLIIVLLGIAFATLNSETVAVNYFVGHRTMALSLLLVSVFVVGCILGILVTGWLLVKAKVRNHSLHKRLKLAEKEVENLRAIPLQDRH